MAVAALRSLRVFFPVHVSSLELQNNANMGGTNDETRHTVLKNHAEDAVEGAAIGNRPHFRALVRQADLGNAESHASSKDDERHGQSQRQEPDEPHQQSHQQLAAGRGVDGVNDDFVAFERDGGDAEGGDVHAGGLKCRYNLAHDANSSNGTSENLQLQKYKTCSIWRIEHDNRLGRRQMARA